MATESQQTCEQEAPYVDQILPLNTSQIRVDTNGSYASLRLHLTEEGVTCLVRDPLALLHILGSRDRVDIYMDRTKNPLFTLKRESGSFHLHYSPSLEVDHSFDEDGLFSTLRVVCARLTFALVMKVAMGGINEAVWGPKHGPASLQVTSEQDEAFSKLPPA